MKRAVLGLALAAVAAIATPQASASPEPVWCGITPRIPCGFCLVDEETGERTCVTPRGNG